MSIWSTFYSGLFCMKVFCTDFSNYSLSLNFFCAKVACKMSMKLSTEVYWGPGPAFQGSRWKSSSQKFFYSDTPINVATSSFIDNFNCFQQPALKQNKNKMILMKQFWKEICLFKNILLHPFRKKSRIYLGHCKPGLVSDLEV